MYMLIKFYSSQSLFKKMNSKQTLYSNLFIYILFFLTCVFVLLQSPLIPFAQKSCDVDSSIFIYSAQQILDGQLMYKDIIDHKGPFLYLINVIALFFFQGNWIGIWLFELLSLFVTGVILYKTALLFAEKWISTLSVITSLLFLVPLLRGGNYPEEWALPYMSMGQYIFLSSIKQDEKSFSKGQLVILALSFVLTFMLKANFVAIFIGYGIIFLIKWILKKKYYEMFHNILLIVVLVFLFILPFFLYFYITDTLSEAMYCVFKYNISEYAKDTFFDLFKRKKLSLFILLILISLFFILRKIDPKYTAYFVSAYLMTFLTCSIGISITYYFIIFVPIALVSFIFTCNFLKKIIIDRKRSIKLMLAFFFLLNSVYIYCQIKEIQDNFSNDAIALQECLLSPVDRNMIRETILKYTKPDEKILVNGYQSSVYLYSEKKCATRFPYSLRNSSLLEECYVKDAKTNLPKMIIQGELVNPWNTYDLSNLLKEKYQKLPINKDDIEFWVLIANSNQ